MTEAALTVLAAEPDQPFALFVEAGDVDFALHANNLDNAIGAVYSGEEAVRAVIRWVETHSNWDDSRPDRLVRPRPLPRRRRSPGPGRQRGERADHALDDWKGVREASEASQEKHPLVCRQRPEGDRTCSRGRRPSEGARPRRTGGPLSSRSFPMALHWPNAFQTMVSASRQGTARAARPTARSARDARGSYPPLVRSGRQDAKEHPRPPPRCPGPRGSTRPTLNMTLYPTPDLTGAMSAGRDQGLHPGLHRRRSQEPQAELGRLFDRRYQRRRLRHVHALAGLGRAPAGGRRHGLVRRRGRAGAGAGDHEREEAGERLSDGDHRLQPDADRLRHRGGREANHASINRRFRAVAALEQQAAAAGRPLNVWLTLPALPTGLDGQGMYVMQAALKYGVKLRRRQPHDDGLRQLRGAEPRRDGPVRDPGRPGPVRPAPGPLRLDAHRPADLADGREHPDDRPERRHVRGLLAPGRPGADHLRRAGGHGEDLDVVAQPRRRGSRTGPSAMSRITSSSIVQQPYAFSTTFLGYED